MSAEQPAPTLIPAWPDPLRPALLACSGGADSVALLHLAVRDNWREQLRVVHFDHRLRADSGADASFVQQLCDHLDLPCEVIELNLGTGSNLQARARAARLDGLAQLAGQHGIDLVLLGHHRDDQVETVLWNLLRGAGSTGLSGMLPRQRFGSFELVRPLLRLNSGELRQWLRERDHDWREDPSNAGDAYLRNRLRHHALPLLAEITGRDVVAPIERSARILGAEDALLEDLAKTRADEFIDANGHLDARALGTEAPGLAWRLIAVWLARYDIPHPGLHGIERVFALAQALALDWPGGSPACTELPGGRRVVRRGGLIQLDSEAGER